ncbi:MAG: SPFH domain-containing protein [Pseudomonadota bacterium]
MNPWTLVAEVVLGLLLIGAAVSLRRVPPESSFTINRWGRFHRTLGPGWHLVLPLIDRVTHRVTTAGQVLDLSCPGLATRDQQAVVAQGRLFIQVLDPRKAANANQDVRHAATDLARSSAQQLVEQMTYTALSERSARELNSWLLGLLNQTASEWGVRVTRVELQFASDDSTDR